MSVMDDIKQDFTKDLKNLMEIEKIGCSLHSRTPDNNCMGPTLAEEIQEKKVNLIQEMSSNQDMCDRNIPRNDGNFYHSYEHTTYQLVDAKKQSNQMCREKISTSSIFQSYEFINFTRRTLKHEILQKEMTKSRSLKKKGSVHSDKKRFQCELCQKHLMSKASLRSHLVAHIGIKSFKKLVHSGKKKFKCDLCQKSLTNMSTLKSHLAAHIGTKPLKQKFKCNLCQKQMLFEALRGHLATHIGIILFKCSICGAESNSPTALKRHEYVHSGHKINKTYNCNICQKPFRNNGHRRMHELIHFKKEAEKKASRVLALKCDMCQKQFHDKTNLRYHLAVHCGIKLFKCPFCQQKFSYPASLKEHEKIHSVEKPFKCPFCLKGFCHLSGVSCHMLIHCNKKQLKCQICEKKFFTSSSLKLYSRVPSLIELKKMIQSDKITLICNFCQKDLKQSLKSQEIIHSGYRSYKCHICQKEFLYLTTFKRHKMSHSGKKPFKCQTCPKAFIQSTHLKRHEMTHSGHRPFCCHICFKGYTQLSNLKRHIMLHHS